MKIIKYSLMATFAAIVLIAIAGIFKFNILQDDIFVDEESVGKSEMSSGFENSAGFQRVCRPKETAMSKLTIGSWEVQQGDFKEVSWRNETVLDVSSIDIVLTPEAAKTLSQESAKYVGRPLVISIDAQVVSAPIVKEPLHGKKISLFISKEHEAAALARKIAPPCH